MLALFSDPWEDIKLGTKTILGADVISWNSLKKERIVLYLFYWVVYIIFIRLYVKIRIEMLGVLLNELVQ